MTEYYLEIRNIHIIAVILSGLLFSARGLGLVLSAQWPRAAWARYLSYFIDTVLLTAALMLMSIVKQYPFTHAWLSVKVLLLVFYIFLGMRAFRIDQSRHKRIVYGVSALAVYLYIVSVAQSHHPLGLFNFFSG